MQNWLLNIFFKLPFLKEKVFIEYTKRKKELESYKTITEVFIYHIFRKSYMSQNKATFDLIFITECKMFFLNVT